MKFALYRGTSTISRLIQWFTRSVYSHVALVFDDGTTYEAVEAGFVRAENIRVNHPAGVIVDILEYKTPLTQSEVAQARAICDELVRMGGGYDYLMVLAGFPLRFHEQPRASSAKQFCSEAAAVVANRIGRPITERSNPWKISPEDVNKSAVLRWSQSVVL